MVSKRKVRSGIAFRFGGAGSLEYGRWGGPGQVLIVGAKATLIGETDVSKFRVAANAASWPNSLG